MENAVGPTEKTNVDIKSSEGKTKRKPQMKVVDGPATLLTTNSTFSQTLNTTMLSLQVLDLSSSSSSLQKPKTKAKQTSTFELKKATSGWFYFIFLLF